MTDYLKKSITVTKKLGPFLSSSGVPVTNLTIAQADIRLSKNGSAFAQSHYSGGGIHDENGYYSITFDDTDTGTAGSLMVNIMKIGALPVWKEYVVLPPENFDTLMGIGDNLGLSIEEIKDAVDVDSGAIEYTYTLLDQDDLPIADAIVWVSTDINDANRVKSGRTDAFGKVIFWLDAGMYYFWRNKSGYNFVNPDPETVS